ncbi:DHH family phosphoesterase [Evansella cellulosilytica]|uniref:Cyclic-di-AMP phosphodiesterase n=1 Tax=Evansella cellulosilytica (strain ATCC 21833 / DSM 2522 / FERM P-1141 / JCM 9156 / N-4) TaxID=649639 RepID=E6TZX2_EVAC2|nr:DHH family phosphoesterase [Evansella cellulosilytica]ADU32538.1 diguanylate cyclase and phosphoesterase [Evansella cellulosilytica DSM 2522]
MPNFLLKRWHGYHVIALFTISVIISLFLTYFHWQFGLVAFGSLTVVLYFMYRAKKQFENQLKEYISTLSYRVNKAGEEAFTNLPFGIILYNDNDKIQWVNPYVTEFLKQECVGEPLNILSNTLPELLKTDREFTVSIEEHNFKVVHDANERLLYLFNVTQQEEIKELYERDKTVIALIYLDNYDEVTPGLDDQFRSKLLSKVTDELNKWAQQYDILLRRTASDRFIAILNEAALELLEEDRFTVLDEVREVTAKESVSLTLSIGIGSGKAPLRELGELAQSSLDLALGRGGDQVTIKQTNGKVRFYGGKSNAVEKRTRVRARVISHAIRDLIVESDKIIIMGHKNPDLDSIGSAIGMMKIAEANGKEASIVLDPEDMNQSVKKLLLEIKSHNNLWSRFITPEEALEEITQDSMLIVVDTHKPSLVIEKRLLTKVDRIIVIDHHRRGEEFIKEAVLVYMEPYASSTAELVTEMLEYQPNHPKLHVIESTALLSGIIVDTKSFAIRTGSRTFDAASYLKSKGADTTIVQKLLKEDIEQYVKRAKLIENAYIYNGGMAIAKGNPEETYGQLTIAQAADTLLTMNDVVASFVISKLSDGRVSISARSLGDINVQVIMEKLSGGGHLTNAATQIDDKDIDEVESLLKDKIDDYFKGGETS